MLEQLLSFSVGFSIQDEALDAAQFAVQEANYHTDVIYVFLLLGIKKRARALWYS